MHLSDFCFFKYFCVFTPGLGQDVKNVPGSNKEKTIYLLGKKAQTEFLEKCGQLKDPLHFRQEVNNDISKTPLEKYTKAIFFLWNPKLVLWKTAHPESETGILNSH